MRSPLLFLSFLLPCLLSASEFFWKYENERDLSPGRIQFYTAPGCTLDKHIPAAIKTPDGENTLALKTTGLKPDAPNHAIQTNFPLRRNIAKGVKLKISFFYKATTNGEFEYTLARNTPPWSMLARNAWRKLSATPNWQLAELECETDADHSSPLATPRLMTGRFPVGETLYIGPVRLLVENEILPLALNREWKVLRNPAASASLILLPENGETAVLKNNEIDLSPPPPRSKNVPEKTAAFLYNAFDSPEAGRMRIGMAADWYFDVHVNGRKVHDAMTGNRSALLQPEDHVFDFPVKKGPNIMAVRVLAGSRGWKFICGTVDADAGRLVKITESKKYRPLDMGRLLVKSGTALDFSALNGPRQKAGELGRVIANTDGKLAFEKAPGNPVRFFSFVYIMANSWRLKNHLWTKQDTEHFADAIANQGYNMVRLHTLDRYLLGYKVNDPQYPDMTVAVAGIPQTAKEIPFDEGNLDRFFYLVHCLKERGIYLNMDLMTTWSGYTMAGYRARKSGEQFREHMFFDEKYRRHWKVASGFLLTTTNPYTGLALKDDPALACIDFLNEQDLRIGDPATMAVFTKPFQGWLKTKYKTGAALSKAWGKPLAFGNTPAIDETLLRAGDTAASDAATFLTETMLEMTDWYVKIVRDEIGYKGIYNQWDMIMRTLEIPVRARLPAIAQHTYFAHPHFIPTSGKAPKTDSSRYLGGVENDMVVDQTSSLGSTYFRAAAMARFLDRPYMITEYSHSAPNRFRHERGLYFGSCAALQGWDVLTTFTDTVRLTLDDAFGGFDNAIDPVSRASEIVTALAWLRGDVRESPHSVAYVPEPEKLFPKNYLAAMSDDYAKTAFLTKVGIVWPSASGEKTSFPVNKTRPSLTIVPEKFSRLNVDQWYVTADNREGGEFPELVRQFRDARLLPESNKTQADRAFYQSDTGELSLDEKAEEMTVVSPRLEGVILKKNHPVDLGKLRVVSCSEPAAIVAASLDKNANLGDASRVLLVIATNAFNTDMVFENKSYYTCLDAGRPPVLIQSVAVSLELTTRHEETPEIYALNMDGTRMEKLGSRLENGRLKLSIDTSGLEHGTPCFEIMFPE